MIDEVLDEARGVGVVAPLGFRAAAVHSGVRKRRQDLALVVSDRPAVVAGSFTQSTVRASNVDVVEAIVRGAAQARAILCVSGNANACTGAQGLLDTIAVQHATAARLGLHDDEVLFAATGVIGEPLPVERIVHALPHIHKSLSQGGGEAFAAAIMTTDKRRKYAARRLLVDGKTVTIGGAAKGSGMIHPNMATMLGFLTTDAAIEQTTLQALLGDAVRRTFNRITVDGDTSTNDMALCLANGAADNAVLRAGHPDLAAFATALEDICREFARAIARDGEGATKLLTVKITGARAEEEAAELGRAIAGSMLVKAAVFGGDPNWGRVLTVLGRSGAAFSPERVTLRIGGYPVYQGGSPSGDESGAKQAMHEDEEVVFELELGAGDATAEAWGCDLSYDYVRINGSYRT